MTKYQYRSIAWLVGLFLTAVLVASCGRHRVSLQPQSGGKPYEVLLVGDSVDDVLSVLETDAEGLPQPEPAFDVSVIPTAHYNQSVWLARAIVIVTIDPERFSMTRLRYEKNLHAAPQMVVYVNSPSRQTLHRDMPRLGVSLRQLLTRFEMNTEIGRLASASNPKSERLVQQVIGWHLKVPADMASHKEGEHFVWLSNNAATGMRNICVYTLPLKPLTRLELIHARDSVMKRNMLGERKGMYVETVESTVGAVSMRENGRKVAIMRGLWAMKGDAMGGPFVAHVVADSAQKRYVVAEAFIYAPEMQKRNIMKQTEAALYTLKAE